MVKVNMMCGKRNFGDDWVHVDGAAKGRKYLFSDDIHLTNALPGSVDLMYCSHGISYFGGFKTSRLLSSWHRVIKSGGTLRIATPDWNVIRMFEVPMVGPIYGIMDMDDFTIQHQTMYTFDSLKAVLEAAGFVNVRRYDHKLTEHPNTGNREDKYDDHSAAYHNGVLISLNVECTKP